MTAKWLFLAAMAVLSACSAEGNDVLLGGGAGHEQLQPPDKLLTDRLVDSVTGLDCNYLTMSVRGRYCRDPNEPHPLGPPPVTCYHSLGTVDCVAAIDPNRDGVAPITYPPGMGPQDLVQPAKSNEMGTLYAPPVPITR